MARKYKKLRTTKDLNRLMTRYYTKSRIIGRLKPMAWVTSGAPIEILVAMGIASVYPENYGALCGARQVATSLCQVAEAQGYSQDLCSYARSHIGSVLDRRDAPMGGLPKPDLLVACNNICGTAMKWYQALAQHYHIPLFILDTPFIHGPQMEEHAVQYVVAQLEELIAWAEKHTGRKLKQKRFMKTLEYSDRAVRLWWEIRELNKARPSPLNTPDLFVNMAPIVVLRGTEDAVSFYEKLKVEVEERVEQGTGAIPEERYRLLWDNIALWYQLFRFFGYFVDFGACFVVDTYTNGWSTSVDLIQGVEGLARTYTAVYINQSLQARAEVIVDLVERFQVDGIVFHSNRSCKPYSLGQYDLRRIVSERTGKPGLIIEADMCDTRAYAEEPLKTRIQAFMETLAAQESGD
jgi:benzoyl-CoA reductase/2-hydroxyglutaryl-CoA dehydratase subunit BcrC/BadD/HgdB